LFFLQFLFLNNANLKSILILGLVIGVVLLVLLFFSILKLNRLKNELILKKSTIDSLLKEQELKFFNAIIKVQEKERQRIAQDLHDRLGSLLSVAKLQYQSVEEYLRKLNIPNLKQYSKANLLLDEACAEVRNISYSMISGTLMKFGLVAALEDLKESIQGINTINIDLFVHNYKNQLEQEVEITIYRIIQELVSNALVHANAHEITIQLMYGRNGLNIIVEDDGNGFDVNNISKDRGIGLKNIRYRVDEIKGELNIDSSLGKGTTVTIDIPLNELIVL